MFSSEQVTKITGSLTTTIGNVMSMFVDLLPVMALIAGAGFGIRMVYKFFKHPTGK